MEISNNSFFSRLTVSRYYRLLQFLRLRLTDQDGGHGLVLVFPTQTERLGAVSKGVFNVFSLLYKLTVLSSLGNLLEVVIGPAVAGIRQAGLVIPDGLVNTLLGLRLEFFRLLFTRTNRRYVEALWRLTDGLDIVLAIKEKTCEVRQLLRTRSVIAAPTGQLRHLTPTNLPKSHCNGNKESTLPRLALTSVSLSLDPLALSGKVGDDVLPHPHDGHCLLKAVEEDTCLIISNPTLLSSSRNSLFPSP